MRQVLFIGVSYLALLLCGAPLFAASGYHYVGTLGQQPIQMDLSIQGRVLTGSYYYEAVGKQITLSGKLGTTHAAALDEFAEDPLRTDTSTDSKIATFSGTFDPSMLRFAGTWQRTDGSAPRPVTLRAVCDYQTQRHSVGNVDLTTILPTLPAEAPGMQAVQRALEQIARDRRQAFLKNYSHQPLPPTHTRYNEWFECRVIYYSADLLSVQIADEEYGGGAHSNTAFLTENYWVRGDTFRLLTLPSLLAPTADYLPTLSKFLLNDLKRQGATMVPDAFSPRQIPPFDLTPAGLTYVFPQYAVGAYVEGSYHVLVPYGVLRPYLQPVGPLARFLPHALDEHHGHLPTQVSL